MLALGACVTFGAPALLGAIFRSIARIMAQVLLSRRVGPVLTAAVLFVTLKIGGATAAVGPPADRLQETEDGTGPESLPAAPPATGLEGQSVPDSPVSERTYRVKPGDSLWAIACRDLSVESKPTEQQIDAHWREIYRLNGDLIGADPNLIYPGQILVLPQQ